MAGEKQAQPYMPPNPFGVKQKYWERIQNMRLLDDTFMTAAFDNNIEATQLLLRVIIEKADLKVVSAKAQVEFKNLYGHSLRMDVDAVDDEDHKYDIEVERNRNRASPERLRYHSAIRDVNSLKPGQDFKELPTSYIIFITEEDYWGEGRPLYHASRKIKENGRELGDRTHFIYVNGKYEGEDPIGLLMADFRESDPAKMHYAELAKRVNALKNSEEEVKKMCQAMEITYNEGLVEGRAEGRVEGRAEGYARIIRRRMRRLGLSVAAAMDDLEIPEEDRQACAEYMERQQESEAVVDETCESSNGTESLEKG